MADNFIKLNKSNVLRLGIKTDEGIDTGEYLEFDLEDIELPLKYQELINEDRKNRKNLKNTLFIIGKRQDVKGKRLLSKNEEDSIKAIQDFMKKEEEIYNIFLGKDGVKKLLNGRKLGWTSLQEIDKIVEKQIAPYLNMNMESITDKIKNKYGSFAKENDNKIEVIE